MTFTEAVGETARILQDNQPFQVITHGDVDGVAAGALALSAFDCEVIIQKRLQLEQVDRSRFTLFLDLGSSQLQAISKGFEHYYVVDHHPTEEANDNCLNPWMHAIDGTRFLCTAATLYLVIRELGRKHLWLSYLGLLGILGDRQPFEEENKQILQDAVDCGILKNETLFDTYNLYEVAEVVNACCRNSKKELALRVCLFKDYEKGKTELKKYKETYKKDLEYLNSIWNTIEEENKNRAACYIYDQNITKKYAGELATDLALAHDRAVIILVKDTEGIKISGRATPPLVQRGMHLGRAFEGFGGGHDIAAGAFLESDEMIETFIEITNERLYHMIAPVVVTLDIPTKNAHDVVKALAVDNKEYQTITVEAQEHRVKAVVEGEPGTVKNVTDDIIACIISAQQMMEGE